LRIIAAFEKGKLMGRLKEKRKKFERPWLNATGVEIPTVDLRPMTHSWNSATWEDYLTWYETGRREALIQPVIYDKTCDEQFESIFEQFAQDSSSENREKCEQVLSLLPGLEALVLRRYFLSGLTEVEIAFELKRSRTGINLIKTRGLSRLKRGNSGDEMSARRFMRGESDFSENEDLSIWEESSTTKIKQDRKYDPQNHKAEIELLESMSLRAALMELPEIASQVLYLRYWCDLSVNEAARLPNRGVNVIEQIESASIVKINRSVLVFETGTNFGGGQ
jgi:DNA-directed RNA polymerase specialized sigma subunit